MLVYVIGIDSFSCHLHVKYNENQIYLKFSSFNIYIYNIF